MIGKRLRAGPCLALAGLLAWAAGAGPLLQAQTAQPKPREIYLTELEPIYARQGYGMLAYNQGVSGRPLRIGSQEFARGLGTHATSELAYLLGGGYDAFDAWVGVDAYMSQYTNASVVFKVFGDGRELFNSGVMDVNTPALRVSVSVAGVNELRLVVSDAGDGPYADHADWAEAKLLGKATPPSPPPWQGPAQFEVRGGGLALSLSAQGGIVGCRIGGRDVGQALRGWTSLTLCRNEGEVSAVRLAGGGVEFTRRLVHTFSLQRCTLIERFLPAKESVRWELEIRGAAGPWSTGVATTLTWPEADKARFWTAWDDPEQKNYLWRDPLILKPFASARFWLGHPHWDEDDPQPNYSQIDALRFSIPIVTVAAPHKDVAVTLALSPADELLEVVLGVNKDGSVSFTRNDHRISSARPVRFSMDLVGHQADWRAGLAWMTRRYPEYFEPPNPIADEIAGLGAYSDWEGNLDAAKLKKMGFRVNWKASYDFPYYGLFVPPIRDDETYPRFIAGNQSSVQRQRAYQRRMREMGFYVLQYWDITEFGGVVSTNLPPPDPWLPPGEDWRDVKNILALKLKDSLLYHWSGVTFSSWYNTAVMDCAAPSYRDFMLEQTRLLIQKFPDSSGICIDRPDWLRFYNFYGDDGISWRHNQPCRSLYWSWRRMLEAIGPMFHSAGKVIFLNALINRTDLMRHVDGIYHEYAFQPWEINGVALQCVRRPGIGWTWDQRSLGGVGMPIGAQPAIDWIMDQRTMGSAPNNYFQRHLYLGLYLTAPLPGNDHAINALAYVTRYEPAWTEQWYLDYGPLFDVLRGRKWVLLPHVLAVKDDVAKANLFEVPGGYVVPVMLGGEAASAQVILRDYARLWRSSALPACTALHPASSTWVTVPVTPQGQDVLLNVPLQRGCAMVKVVPSTLGAHQQASDGSAVSR